MIRAYFPIIAEDGKVEVGPLRGPPPDRSPDQELLRLTLLGYCVVLLVCLYVLWTFGRLDGKPLFPAARREPSVSSNATGSRPARPRCAA